MPNYLTKTDIANGALSILGQGPILNLDATANPSDKILTTLKFWYEKSVEVVLRDLNFELEMQFVHAVMLVKDPTPEWSAAYYLDPNWIKFARILSGSYPDSRTTQVPHRKLRGQGASTASINSVTVGTSSTPSIFGVSGMVNGQVVAVTGLTDGGAGNFTPSLYYLVGMATALTCQLFSIDKTPDPTKFSNYNTNGIPIYLATPSLVSARLTPVEHQRIYCNLFPNSDSQTQLPLPMFEVGMIPAVLIWPDDFAKCVCYQLALDAGTGIIGIDHKEQVDSLRIDYANAKARASGTMGKESWKGVRKLSESTLSRFRRVGRNIPGTSGSVSGYSSATTP